MLGDNSPVEIEMDGLDAGSSSKIGGARRFWAGYSVINWKPYNGGVLMISVSAN